MRKYVKALTNLVIALVILLLVIFLLPRLLVYFSPFVVGWIIALLASPLVQFFERKLRIKRKAGSAFVIIFVIAVVVLLLYLLGARLVEELIGFLNDLPGIWKDLESDLAITGKKFSAIYDRLPKSMQEGLASSGDSIASFLGEKISSISAPTINAVSSFAKQLPTVIIGVVMALLSSYFFVADRNVINAWFKRHMAPAFVERYMILKRSMVKAVGGYFKAQLKIEVWIYLLLVIGMGILRIEYTLLIALGIALLDFFPVFGTGTAMIPWAIVDILSTNYKRAIGLLIIWGVSQLVRQLIQPKIVGDSVGVAPIPTLFLLYIGFKISGVFGMIVAVPLGLIVYTMYQEGLFRTTRDSIRILTKGVNDFRRLEKEDLAEEEEMRELNRKRGGRDA